MTDDATDAPVSPISGQFALNSTGTTDPTAKVPEFSPTVRPWALRRTVTARGPGRALPPWRYDHELQRAVDAEGVPLIRGVAGDPSADTTATQDGEDGPSSEDWDND